MMKISIIISIMFFATALCGQTATRLNDPSGLYSFVPPAGWNSKASDEGFAVVNQQQTIIMLVKSHDYADFAGFAKDANLAGDGLTLIGEPKVISGGNYFRTAKQMPKGIMVVDTCVLFSPHGGGVVIANLTDEPNAAASYDRCMSVSKSVSFSKPQQAAVSRSPLSGKHLLYLYTGNGYSERKDIYLCASGGFYQSTNLGGFTPNNSNGGSFGALGQKHGTWSIAGTKLVLKFQNGGTTNYTISKRQAGNEIGLNGNRFFVQAQNICQ